MDSGTTVQDVRAMLELRELPPLTDEEIAALVEDAEETVRSIAGVSEWPSMTPGQQVALRRSGSTIDVVLAAVPQLAQAAGALCEPGDEGAQPAAIALPFPPAQPRADC